MQVFYEFNVLACTHFMFFSSWAVELAPTNTLVTPFCCNIQASAISASVSSLSPASAFHFLSFPAVLELEQSVSENALLPYGCLPVFR